MKETNSSPFDMYVQYGTYHYDDLVGLILFAAIALGNVRHHISVIRVPLWVML